MTIWSNRWWRRKKGSNTLRLAVDMLGDRVALHFATADVDEGARSAN